MQLSRLGFKAVAKQIATLGPLGYAPAPGTVGSAVTLLLVYSSHRFMPELFFYTLFIIAISGIAFYVIAAARTEFSTPDPKQIILDEVIGCLFCFYGLNIDWYVLLWGFLLFRFFDITKCLGIGYLEKLPGAWGVLADDIACGLITNGLLRCIALLGMLKA